MFFYLICLKYCACHEKVRPGHTKCCTCHATSSNLKSWCSKMQSLSVFLGKSAPWPPNISDAHVSCTEPATRNASLQLFFKGPTHAIRFSTETKPSHFTYFWQGAESIAPATKNDAWASKNGWTWCAFIILTSKCASRHNGEHFFDSSTSKSAPTLRFSFRNVLRATIACTFSTAQLPKVFRHSNVFFGILTWKRASRHSRVTFARLNFQNCSEHELPHASAPAAVASLLFDPLEPQNIAKRQCLATSRLFAHFDLLSTDPLSSDSFSSRTAPATVAAPVHKWEVWLINFLRSNTPDPQSIVPNMWFHRLHPPWFLGLCDMKGRNIIATQNSLSMAM